MMHPPLTRRALLKGLVALSVFALPRNAAAVEPSDLGRDLARLLPHPESARSLGATYLERRPQAVSRDLLLARLGVGDARPSRPEEMLAMHQAVFRTRRVVTLLGWTLSVTELRLCALVAL